MIRIAVGSRVRIVGITSFDSRDNDSKLGYVTDNGTSIHGMAYCRVMLDAGYTIAVYVGELEVIEAKKRNLPTWW